DRLAGFRIKAPHLVLDGDVQAFGTTALPVGDSPRDAESPPGGSASNRRKTPQLLAACRVKRLDDQPGSDDIHHASGHYRGALDRSTITGIFGRRVVHPGRLESRRVAGSDL